MMVNLLAIDTTSNLASTTVAITDNNVIHKFSYNENNKQTTHSQKLLPVIHKSLKELSMDIKDIDVFLITNGPGSFTRYKDWSYYC